MPSSNRAIIVVANAEQHCLLTGVAHACIVEYIPGTRKFEEVKVIIW